MAIMKKARPSRKVRGKALTQEQQLSKFRKRFMNLNQACDKLQISPPTFKKLCIAKGIHPVEPTNVPDGVNKDKAYYSYKDIVWLQKEPYLATMFQYETYKKKVRSLVGKDQKYEARRFAEYHRPTIDMTAILRERYPTLRDAIDDLDDALCNVALFSKLPAITATDSAVAVHAHLTTGLREDAIAVYRRFEDYVISHRLLRRAFISIKGFYFGIRLQHRECVFTLPHAFPHKFPRDVDGRTLTGFLHFSVNHLSAVLARLQRLDDGADVVAESGPTAALTAGGVEDASESDDGAEGGAGGASRRAAGRRRRGRGVSDDVPSDQEAQSGDESDSGEDSEGGDGAAARKAKKAAAGGAKKRARGEGEEADDADMRIRGRERNEAPQATLFEGLTFALSSEVPRSVFSFAIRACGGKVLGEKEDAATATHVVLDRPLPAGAAAPMSKDFIQPQWVFDSINVGSLLPVHAYAPGAELPAHVSPFENPKELRALQEKAATASRLRQERAERHGGAAALAAKERKLAAATGRGVSKRALLSLAAKSQAAEEAAERGATLTAQQIADIKAYQTAKTRAVMFEGGAGADGDALEAADDSASDRYAESDPGDEGGSAGSVVSEVESLMGEDAPEGLTVQKKGSLVPAPTDQSTAALRVAKKARRAAGERLEAEKAGMTVEQLRAKKKADDEKAQRIQLAPSGKIRKRLEHKEKVKAQREKRQAFAVDKAAAVQDGRLAVTSKGYLAAPGSEQAKKASKGPAAKRR